MADSTMYCNADKLVAVIDFWAKPLISQLPLPYSLLAPSFIPMVSSFLKKIPDDSIPQAANSIIDDAVTRGTISIGKVTLDTTDLIELQRLIKVNLPCEKVAKVGYEVKTK